MIGAYIHLEGSAIMGRNIFFYASYFEKMFQGVLVQFFVRTKLGKTNS